MKNVVEISASQHEALINLCCEKIASEFSQYQNGEPQKEELIITATKVGLPTSFINGLKKELQYLV